MSETSDDKAGSGRRSLYWLLRGMATAFSVPGLILSSAFIGFGGLAKESGISLLQAVFMVGTVWALPANVVLIGNIVAGASLPAAAFAVALSSVRLMPMVVALVPEMRTPKTRSWVLYLLSHCVAVTSWVLAMERFRRVPRDMRTVFYGGLGWTLVVVNMGVVAVVYAVADELPPAVAAALFLITPIYFLLSLWGSARERASHVAMVVGIVLGPLLHLVVPGFDLLIAGTVGGGIAYLFHRKRQARAAA
ncbi:AzlC family ABC transporter permease [Oryzicola mucosus]|uniref:AzlC family ABC transporter permease n=1 Tax=Oryzicola mucosus TaxID=2767425 RepID=A0A8J6PJT7_9HYPH|nr:AzlC family ABC transporter permease [Oryzicola mucosus]MBD0416314.1 AzlC family ABC transporter permease [Oryzicola mucosus]